MEKHEEYAVKILDKVQELLQDEIEEISEGTNATDFIHALANTVPNIVYNKLTGDDKNNLEFNHFANNLVFQFSKKHNP